MIDTNINMIKEPTGFLVALKLIPIERAIGKSKMIQTKPACPATKVKTAALKTVMVR